MTSPPLLDIADLSIRFAPGPATVDAATLSIARGEIVALVGESGSGKSLIAHSIAGILSPAARLDASRFTFGGIDLAGSNPRAWQDLRGREIGIVFQNPRAALNPVRRVGDQIADVIRQHRGLSGRALAQAIGEALASVRIPDPQRRARAFPHELSGGMCQRVMLAIALAGRPSLLIADEPTTGLDTTTQAAILELILEHAASRRMATLLITHDLGLARAYAERILVMHAGQIAEAAPAPDLFARPRHPYAAALIGATPAACRSVADLTGIAGTLPRLAPDMPACRFAGRCDRAVDDCRTAFPPDRGEAGHRVHCWRPL